MSDSDTPIPSPRENPDLLGHEEAERLLAEAFAAGRLAHAWLISGPKGIGKATLAYRFARHVLVLGKDGGDAGGLFADAPESGAGRGLYLAPNHPVFQRVAAGGHTNLFTLQRTVNDKTGKLRTEIVVVDVRAAGHFFAMTAGENGWRVCVVDCADELNPNAANALLKVLEEPPNRALLLLVSHNPGRLLATIRSRCRRLVLKPLEPETVAGLVRARVPDLQPADALRLAHLADGSPGHAMALAAGDGLEIYDDMTALLATLPGLDVPSLHAFSGRLGKAGAEPAFETGTALLRWWLQRLIVARADTGADGDGSADAELIRRIGAAAGLDRWFQVWEKTDRLLAKTDSVNLDRKQVVLNVFLTIQDAVRS